MGFPILDGFDLYASTSVNTGLLSRWSNQSAAGGPALIAGRFGGQALRMTDGSGGTSHIRRAYATAHSDFSIGFAFRHNSAGTAFSNGPILRLEFAATSQLSVYADGNGGAGGILRVYRGLGVTALITSAAGVFVQSAYCYIQVLGKIDQTVGFVELYANGNFIGRFDGDTAALAGVQMNGIILSCVDHTGSGNAMDFDDLYVADESTNFGQCRIESLRPSADTAQKDLTPSTAGTNFDDVDDVTFSTTDYVDGSTIGHYDLYDLANLSSNPQNIYAVKPLVCANKTDAGARLAAAVIDSGGTLSTSDDLLIASDPLIFDGQTLLTNPNGGAAWDGAAVDALKLGPKVAA